MKLEDIIHHKISIHWNTLKTDDELVRQIQTKLSAIALYPEGKSIDGRYGSRTEQALTEFCQRFSLSHQKKQQLDRHFAEKLLAPPATPSPNLTVGRDRLYTEFLNTAQDGTVDHPKFFYQGVHTSPRLLDIPNYPSYLMRKPNHRTVTAFPEVTPDFQPYPSLGKIPPLQEKRLDFLHPDITEACICVGSFTRDQLYTKWLSRNALHNDEFWSATKIIPLLYTLSQISEKAPQSNIDYCNIRGWNSFGDYINIPLQQLANDLISYEQKIATSNSLGAMFKRFIPQTSLETWLKKITGNHRLIFQGRYGETPFVSFPELYNRTTAQKLLTSDPNPPRWESNTLSAYDLTRMISLLGWHYYLPTSARLPEVQWHHLECAVKALGQDSARLTDVALQKLNLESYLNPIVVLSKLGNGVTSMRHRTEAVYVAFVHLLDNRPQNWQQPSRLITYAMALRGAKKLDPRNPNQEAKQLDARMVTEVTEIVRRALQGEL